MNENIALLLLLVGGALWWLLYGLECFLNGGSGPFMHLKCLVQDASWLIPYFRIKFVKEMVEYGNGTICLSPPLYHQIYCFFTKKKIEYSSITYQEVREKRLYRLVARQYLPGLFHFVFMHFFVPLLPLIVGFAIYDIYKNWTL
jgi:hypothetical protein